MASQYAYAAKELAKVIRQHGIYELREVLTQALQVAAKADSAEEVADALEAANL